jgi:adenylyl-sulfate kinase
MVRDGERAFGERVCARSNTPFEKNMCCPRSPARTKLTCCPDVFGEPRFGDSLLHVDSRGFTIWFTGLPCSGKSTLARKLARKLLRRGRRVEVLDGDLVRQSLSYGLGFNREDRDRNIQRVAFVANLLARNGVVVIVAVVSPYRAARDEARRSLQRFFEVHVDCPVSECERRDVKGMYKRARAGDLHGFTGVDDPYEVPLAPELTVATNLQSSDESAACVESALVESQLLSASDPILGDSPELEQRYAELFVWRSQSAR